MQTDKIFHIIKLHKFMHQYAPGIKQFGNKNIGSDGRKPINYTPQDKKDIKNGIKLLIQDLKKAIK